MASNIPQSGSTPPPPPNWGAPPPPTWNAVPEGGAVRFAGFWIRFVAYIIDFFVLGIVGSVLGALVGVGVFSASGNDTEAQATSGLVGFVIGLVYYAAMESSSTQGTLGKMALGLKVVRGDGSRLSFGRAVGRYFAKLISAFILLIGYIMAGFTERKRALHDMIADTLVIKAR